MENVEGFKACTICYSIMHTVANFKRKLIYIHKHLNHVNFANIEFVYKQIVSNNICNVKCKIKLMKIVNRT